MFWTLKVATASTLYSCSTISSNGSTANAAGNNARAPRRHAVAVALWAARDRGVQTKRGASHSEAATEEALFIAQRHHRIDFHGAPRGNVTGHRGRDHEQAHHARIGDDVGRAHAVEHRRQQPGEAN